jgi:hypothetical protein
MAYLYSYCFIEHYASSSVDWAQLSRILPEDGDRIVSEKLCLNLKKNRTLGSVKKYSNCDDLQFHMLQNAIVLNRCSIMKCFCLDDNGQHIRRRRHKIEIGPQTYDGRIPVMKEVRSCGNERVQSCILYRLTVFPDSSGLVCVE